MPLDLATFYASKGGVDLSTLSELTKSVGVSDDGMDNTRSKRTCVRVREEISKLEEILKDDNSDAKPSPVSKQRSGRGKGRGSTSRAATGANKSAELEGEGDESVGAPSAKKYKRPAYSQFTHKRRKRKKKPEEGTV